MVTPSWARANLEGIKGMIPLFILIASCAVARTKDDGIDSTPLAIGLVTAVVALATLTAADGSDLATSLTLSRSGPPSIPASAWTPSMSASTCGSSCGPFAGGTSTLASTGDNEGSAIAPVPIRATAAATARRVRRISVRGREPSLTALGAKVRREILTIFMQVPPVADHH